MSAPDNRAFRLDWPRSKAVRGILERVTGLASLDREYRTRPAGLDDGGFLRWTLSTLNVDTRVDEADLARIPKSGPVLVIANHPFGGMEGIALASTLKRVRPDVKVLANFLLGRIPELRDLFVFVDPFERSGVQASNTRGLRAAVSWLSDGGLLAVFPAGEVASLDWRSGRIRDPRWNPTVSRLARRTGADTVPVFVPGRNRAIFHAAGFVHPAARTALLAREFLARRGKPVALRFGTPVPAARLREFPDDVAATAYLRDLTEILAERGGGAPAPPAGAIQPRRTPREAAPIVAPQPPAALEAEIGALPEDALLIESEGLQVLVARAAQIPATLREIGRLRELTFREVGEGTGREIDIDVFDATYLHLFIWSRADRQVVGAYRLGPTDELIPRHGIRGLYTASLFRYDARLFEAMGPALEMGRSWIRIEHQKSYAGLMLLWKGIGQFVGRHPRYATLFGPVSISAEYRSASQRLIVAFLERNRKLGDWARWVRPTNPFRESAGRGARRGPAELRDLEDVSTFISEIEADQKGVPILLKQYLRLDGRLLGYNVDPDFANVLDVLILVDLRTSPAKALARYMGRENLERFRTYHQSARTDTRAS